MHKPSVIIEIISMINSDGYFCDGKFYDCKQRELLINHIKEKSINDEIEIEFIKGKNSFTGNIINDKFYNDMKESLINLL